MTNLSTSKTHDEGITQNNGVKIKIDPRFVALIIVLTLIVSINLANVLSILF